jgi:hypothetical protein
MAAGSEVFNPRRCRLGGSEQGRSPGEAVLADFNFKLVDVVAVRTAVNLERLGRARDIDRDRDLVPGEQKLRESGARGGR